MTFIPQKNKRLLLGQEGNALVSLIVLNAVVFVIVTFIKIGYFLSGLEEASFYNSIMQWLVVAPEPVKLFTRPWSVLVYMFTHISVWAMISNMLWLWAFGYILQDLTGNKHLAPVYIYGGLAGAFAFVLTVNGFSVLSQSAAALAPLQGAGAALMAVSLATTTLAPGYRLFPMLNGGIPLWVLTLIFVVIDFALIASMGAGTAIAHLTAGLVGFLYVKAMQRGSNWGSWMHKVYHGFFQLFQPSPQKTQATIRQMHYKAGPEPFKTKTSVNQQRVDELLDKISSKGIQTLTEEEKEFLKRASQTGK